MTTSLPTTPSNELLPGAAPSLAGNAPVADGLAALLAITPCADGVPPPGFAALLDGGAASAPAAASAATIPSAAASQTGATVAPSAPAGAASAPRAVTLATLSSDVQPTSTTDVRGFAFATTGGKSTPVTTSADAAAAAQPSAPRPAEAGEAPSLPDRTTLEAIVALLLPVATAVAPETTVPTLDGDTPAAPQPAEVGAPGDSPELAATANELPARAQVTIALPGRAPVTLDEAMAAASDAGLSAGSPVEFSAVAPSVTQTASAPSAVETRALPLPASLPAAAAPQAQAPELEVTASAELADGSVVTLALPAAPAAESQPSDATASGALSAGRPEKTAAASAEKKAVNFVAEDRIGKNFLSTEEQELSPAREEAGIGVAQPRSTMLFTPHDTLSAVHATVPALVSTVAAAPQALAASAPAAEPTLVTASVAHRAVETVTAVVEAQAASKLQPVPSVQLKFKVGAEDLAVRVALRDGIVHTEFRTDSPELRAAIQQEWKAVTAQPESALRFLDPVVVPASSSAQSGTNSFAQQQHQQPGQSAAQQQQQQQQQSRAAAEVFGSVARSTPFQPREGGAASSVAPISLPTSVHLSAVA